jgi:hypothetical protein
LLNKNCLNVYISLQYVDAALKEAAKHFQKAADKFYILSRVWILILVSDDISIGKDIFSRGLCSF